MRLIDLDEFFRQNCIDRMEGKSCEECKHHVLEVSCERLMEQPIIDPVKHGRWIVDYGACEPDYMECSCCNWITEYYGGLEEEWNYCPNCGARMDEVTE